MLRYNGERVQEKQQVKCQQSYTVAPVAFPTYPNSYCCNVATTFSIGFLGNFTTDYSDFFPFIET